MGMMKESSTVGTRERVRIKGRCINKWAAQAVIKVKLKILTL